MKTTFVSIFSVLCIISGYAFTNLTTMKEAKNKLEITVDYDRQAGRGSNQYAVWIEDAAGNLVKTLYVTRFTAEGGYKMRPDCTPNWVTKANASSLNKTEIDAFSGATPQTGKQVYRWDGTDHSGKEVQNGNYTFVVEATYLGKNRVVFKSEFKLGGEEQVIQSIPDFNSDEQQNRTMIREVTARYIP